MSTLIRGGHVLTMDPALGSLPAGDVLVRDGRIVAVAERIDETQTADCEVLDAAGAIVLPGLVDGHRHVWQSLLRGAASDWTLPQYMVEARSMFSGCFDAEAAYLANLVGGLESLAAGITTVVDHSHLQTDPDTTDALVRGLRDSRVGGYFCYALQNVVDYQVTPPTDPDEIRAALTGEPGAWHDENIRRVRAEYFSDPNGRLRLGIALPESAPFLPVPALKPLAERVAALDPALVTSHWSMTIRDGDPDKSRLGWLARHHEWNGHTVLTHANGLDDADLAELLRAGIGVCTTPDVECGMGSGPLLARRFVAMGGSAALGMDLSSYTAADILRQAHLLLQSERASLAAADPMPAAETPWPTYGALELATRVGAEAVGLGAEVGTLTPGKRGDVIVVRPDLLRAGPDPDPVAALLFYTTPADVETVLVEGEVVKRAGRLTGVDLDQLGRDTAHAAARIHERYEALPRPVLEKVWAGMFSD
ncbi:amidohydrolase family protein [Streptomyces spongiae]|uniref:Amidohydrolase family protein n=1 Tax=Streptomyces spongiae TaxID=565072 RepID=A0A5N8X9W8_9ACTN|nr:amidohydrolase family protein [Streptomyces spongiae]MPY56177.1 amidohydrolase family protein [Streptomyces spongiae]